MAPASKLVVAEVAREDPVTLAVVIVTFERQWHLERCLSLLAAIEDPPDEVLVVDGAGSDATKATSRRHGARYIDSGLGYGHMTEARNIGIRMSGSEIVAFIDDDSFVRAGWSTRLRAAFRDARVSGVGGRAVTNPEQQPVVATPVGQITTDGSLIANFETASSTRVPVLHVIGCNMAFRRTALEGVGTFRPVYPGTALREETDLCLRLIEAGHHLVFDPQVEVVHVGAPHAKGRRFDLRYRFYGQRNHTQLLATHLGIGPVFYRHLRTTTRVATTDAGRSIAAAVVKPAIDLVATAAGLRAAARVRRSEKKSSLGLHARPNRLEVLLTGANQTPADDNRWSEERA